MRLNKKTAFLREIFFPFVIFLMLIGCASQQKPQGGPRDRTPPKLLKATPPNMTRNFKAKQIKLDFDEYFNATAAAGVVAAAGAAGGVVAALLDGAAGSARVVL